MSDLALLKQEVEKELSDPSVANALIQTTFKGLQPETMKLAMLDGVIRGFNIKDFLERNVYAIAYNGKDGQTYSLVTSIDYARKIAMRSGILGIDAPVFEEQDGKIISCSVTVKRKVGDEIGEFVGKVYFDEYYRKPIIKNGYEIKSLWDTKPRTMIGKVAEMHALRKACPEELSQAYTEEEMERETVPPLSGPKAVDVEACNAKLMAATTIEELQSIWVNLTKTERDEPQVLAMKESMKKTLIPNVNEDPKLQ